MARIEQNSVSSRNQVCFGVSRINDLSAVDLLHTRESIGLSMYISTCVDTLNAHFTLHFAVVPVCQHGQTRVFGVARQETASIPCELEANPPEVSFTWKFNNTMEAVDIPQAHVTSDRTRSTASYTPMTELDYGTLLCWGSNDQGGQLEPCVFHIVPAGKCQI